MADQPTDSPQSIGATASAGTLIITNAWDSFSMCGNGSMDLWKLGNKYYVAMDGINYEDDLPDPDSLAAMEGPFDDVAAPLKENVGSILSIGPATQFVTSRVHTVSDLRDILRVEPCLLEGEEDLKEWFIKVNGVKHRVDAKTFDISPVRGTRKTRLPIKKKQRRANGH
jgi:hypothetical protein